MAMQRIQCFIAFALLIVATQAQGLPTCYIEPYAAALNVTTCGPLDVQCVCQSSTYLNVLQDDVPRACEPAEQSPIFSYIMAACSEFGAQITLSTTSAALTTSTIPTATVTSIVTVTDTQSTNATAIAAAATSTCPKRGLSSSASIGAVIGAFLLGGLLFAVAAVIILRTRRARKVQNQSDTPASFSQSPQTYVKLSPVFEAENKRPRAEIMMTETSGSSGRPAELS